MLNVRQILVSAVGLALVGVGLTACGQRGALYLPTGPAAKDRATLPELLIPGGKPASDAAAAPAQPGPSTNSSTTPSNANTAPAKNGDAK
ncbi:LPS translocon maturation chaperone LptM [Variovorax sp. GT1P44]|uniref:LPS translocon maturation chaperone LptM n=1 Tax=Variovorax sp. GT1P44 TaxID=3443742 RepID=UPI003F47EA9E